MKVDTNALVSATDLNRNSGQLISRAADGERLVILNQNRPVAAIVPIDDLRRLESLDDAALVTAGAPRAGRPEGRALADLCARPGYTAVGETSLGEIAELRLACNTWVVASEGSELDAFLSAALDGARASDRHPIQFAIASTELASPVRLHEANRTVHPIVTIATDVADDYDRAQRFANLVSAQLRQRKELLQRAEVASVEEFRRTRPDEASEVADLVVVVLRKDCDRFGNPAFRRLVDVVLRKSETMAVYAWILETESGMGLASPDHRFPQSLALRMSRMASARRVVGSDAPTQLTEAGLAYLCGGSEGQHESAPDLTLVHLAPQNRARAGRFAADPAIAWDTADTEAATPGA